VPVVQIMVQVFSVSGETVIPYVLSKLLCCLLYSTYKTSSLCYVFYVILKNIILRVIEYRLVLLVHIREAQL